MNLEPDSGKFSISAPACNSSSFHKHAKGLLQSALTLVKCERTFERLILLINVAKALFTKIQRLSSVIWPYLHPKSVSSAFCGDDISQLECDKTTTVMTDICWFLWLALAATSLQHCCTSSPIRTVPGVIWYTVSEV